MNKLNSDSVTTISKSVSSTNGVRSTQVLGNPLDSQLKPFLNTRKALVDNLTPDQLGKFIKFMATATEMADQGKFINILFNTISQSVCKRFCPYFTVTSFIESKGLLLLLKWLSNAKKENNLPIQLNILNLLKKLPFDIESLKPSQVGKFVNQLSKSESTEVSTLATEIVIKWKKLLSEPKVIEIKEPPKQTQPIPPQYQYPRPRPPMPHSTPIYPGYHPPFPIPFNPNTPPMYQPPSFVAYPPGSSHTYSHPSGQTHTYMYPPTLHPPPNNNLNQIPNYIPSTMVPRPAPKVQPIPKRVSAVGSSDLFKELTLPSFKKKASNENSDIISPEIEPMLSPKFSPFMSDQTDEQDDRESNGNGNNEDEELDEYLSDEEQVSIPSYRKKRDSKEEELSPDTDIEMEEMRERERRLSSPKLSVKRKVSRESIKTGEFQNKKRRVTFAAPHKLVQIKTFHNTPEQKEYRKNKHSEHNEGRIDVSHEHLETTLHFTRPKLIDNPHSIQRGKDGRENSVQSERESRCLSVTYYDKSQIPESPDESQVMNQSNPQPVAFIPLFYQPFEASSLLDLSKLFQSGPIISPFS